MLKLDIFEAPATKSPCQQKLRQEYKDWLADKLFHLMG